MVKFGADRPADPAAKLAAALGQLARARRIHRQDVATRHGLSPLQLELLATIAAGEPPEPSVGLLARELGITQPTATDAITALERKGLVRRDRVVDRRRRTHVRLTPPGRELASLDDPFVAAAHTVDPDLRDATLEGALSMIAALVHDGTITVARTCLTCRFHRRDGDGGSRCDLLGMPLPRSELRVNCPEHQPAEPAA
ncbi:MarR family transcriptional regulator [Agromyces sp. NPDC058484]|uniref:MarR family transcriptional regulator n=1 Tax=Agromyces sp. NPDC058484 TaxID=3346524 RepID=UPI003658CCDB